jgi:hypothetical protein
VNTESSRSKEVPMTPIIKHRVLPGLLLAGTASIAAAQTITSISPASVPAGSPNLALTVTGANFSADAIVEINGDPHLTIPAGSTVLKSLLYASDLSKPGTLTVTVLNDSGAVAHLSNKVNLTVTGIGTKPQPPAPPTPPPPVQSKVSIAITSPAQNQQVCAPVTILASAITTNPGADIARWQIYSSQGALLWSTNTPVSSIDPKLSFATGIQTVEIEAWDSTGAAAHTNIAFDVTTATPPCGGNASGVVTSWQGCMHSVNGLNHQAIDFSLSQGSTLPFNGTLYFGPNCIPANWADEFGFGQKISFGGFSYIFWFSDFPNQPNTSAIWTVGNQSSGCINYNAVPQC